MADLASGVLDFSKLLNRNYGFTLGHADVRTALQAVHAAGVSDKHRFRYALRVVYCSKVEQLVPFDLAFDRFFGNSIEGQPQPRPAQPQGDTEAHAQRTARRELHDETAPSDALQTMRARYSPVAANIDAAAQIPESGLAETLADAGRLIAALHLGRSRKWKPHVRGKRLDIRRTLRSSLESGGDPLRLRTFGHPLRNPRIVLLIDASRSMADYALGLLQFGYALCRRSRRTSVFVFSTALSEITKELRRLPHTRDREIALAAQTWGGGTRLGSALRDFSKQYRSRVNSDTLVLIASDGLDTGGTTELREALRRLHRTSAGIIWLNPHAGATGFAPAAGAMQAAMPYVCALLDARDLRALAAATRTLRR